MPITASADNVRSMSSQLTPSNATEKSVPAASGPLPGTGVTPSVA